MEEDGNQEEECTNGISGGLVVLHDETREVQAEERPGESEQGAEDDHEERLDHLAHALARVGEDGRLDKEEGRGAKDGDDVGVDGDGQGQRAGDGALDDALPEVVGLPVTPDDAEQSPKHVGPRHRGRSEAISQRDVRAMGQWVDRGSRWYKRRRERSCRRSGGYSFVMYLFSCDRGVDRHRRDKIGEVEVEICSVRSFALSHVRPCIRLAQLHKREIASQEASFSAKFFGTWKLACAIRILTLSLIV